MKGSVRPGGVLGTAGGEAPAGLRVDSAAAGAGAGAESRPVGPPAGGEGADPEKELLGLCGGFIPVASHLSVPIPCIGSPERRACGETRESVSMNWLDAAILLAMICAGVFGVSRGAAIQIGSLSGAAAGLALAAAAAPALSHLLSGEFAKILITLASVFVAVTGLGAVGRRYGGRAYKALQARNLGLYDTAAGAMVGVLATLLAVWMIAGILSAVNLAVPRAVAGSGFVGGLDDVLGNAPGLFTRLAGLVYPGGLPSFFQDIGPASRAGIKTPRGPVVTAAVAKAGRSTVKVVGAGCGGIKSGTGFVAGPGLVVTNAHVVAGVAQPDVVDANGRHRTTTVVFNPFLDVAVLRVSHLAGPPLTVDRTVAGRGTQGAVLGYPGGGGFQAGPAAVLAHLDALENDIYNRSAAPRSIYEIDAVVEPGDSGGPLVTPSGAVTGMIFAASAIRHHLAYTLTGPDIAPLIDRAATLHAAVSHATCPP
jgi:uncharacterized membrane protein required for colicin V production